MSKGKKSAIEKQSIGVLNGVRILWGNLGGVCSESVAEWFHGAGMVTPATKRELQDEFYFLSDVARIVWRMDREGAA